MLLPHSQCSALHCEVAILQCHCYRSLDPGSSSVCVLTVLFPPHHLSPTDQRRVPHDVTRTPSVVFRYSNCATSWSPRPASHLHPATKELPALLSGQSVGNPYADLPLLIVEYLLNMIVVYFVASDCCCVGHFLCSSV